jgi:hypothetical protein
MFLRIGLHGVISLKTEMSGTAALPFEAQQTILKPNTRPHQIQTVSCRAVATVSPFTGRDRHQTGGWGPLVYAGGPQSEPSLPWEPQVSNVILCPDDLLLQGTGIPTLHRLYVLFPSSDLQNSRLESRPGRFTPRGLHSRSGSGAEKDEEVSPTSPRIEPRFSVVQLAA